MSVFSLFKGFTFNHSGVSGNRLDRPAAETKALLDSRGKELMEFINKILTILNSPEGADFINTKDLNGKQVSIASILDELMNGGLANNAEVKKLKEIFESLIINAGNSNAEIVAARYDAIIEKNFSDLPSRLDDIRDNILTHSSIVVCDEIPEIKRKNTFYFKVTDKQSGGSGNGNLKVSPNMGLKLVDEKKQEV